MKGIRNGDIAWNEMRCVCYQASLLPGSFYVIAIWCFYISKTEHGDDLLQAVGKGLGWTRLCYSVLTASG